MLAGWFQAGDGESAEADHGYVAPVKNTFIHYECEEQPDYKPARSGPARVEENRRSHLPAISTISSQEETETVSSALGDDVGPEDPTMPGGGSPSSRKQTSSTLQALEAPPVKNTFIHFDFDDSAQPEYFSAVSGPAVLHSASPPRRSSKGTAEGQLENTLVEADEAQEEAALPSIGSANHALGNCKPCAHAWKDAGCSKGASCTFCHLCEADDFRRRRKEKTQRLKAERSQRKKGDKDEGLSAESAPRPVGPISQIPGVVGAQAVPGVGELLTHYDADAVYVRWCVDLRRMASQYRYGTSRRFTLTLPDTAEEVPFVLFLNPAASDEATPVFAASNLRATLQVKCTDPSLIATCLHLCFEIEGLQTAHQVKAHNFRMEPLCLAQGTSWQLSGSTQALIRLVLRPSRSAR